MGVWNANIAASVDVWIAFSHHFHWFSSTFIHFDAFLRFERPTSFHFQSLPLHRQQNWPAVLQGGTPVHHAAHGGFLHVLEWLCPATKGGLVSVGVTECDLSDFCFLEDFVFLALLKGICFFL